MKTIFTLLAVCFSYAVVASHHVGGYIVAKQVNGRLYQITTVLLSDPNSPANNATASITLDFGDGKTETVNRTAISTEDGVQRNTYITEHQYAADGLFTISCSDPNFPANIVNLNGGFSDNVPFTTTCWIRVSSTLSGVKSANPLAVEYVKGYLNNTVHYNPTFVGGEENTVTYELVTQSPSLPNYTLPQESSINPYSGMLTFTPKSPGLYLFVIRVSSYRYGNLIAQSDLIPLTKILDGVTTTPTVDFPDASTHPQGWRSRELLPNQSVTQLVTFTGNNDQFTAEVYSELFDKSATSSITRPIPNIAAIEVNWTALPAYERTTPYFITYRYRRNANNLIDDYNIAFYHGAPINTGIDDQASTNQMVIVYPNPVFGTTQCFFVFEDFQKGHLYVYDILGRTILSQLVNGQTHMLEIKDWKPGMYTYTYTSQNGENLKGKLQID